MILFDLTLEMEGLENKWLAIQLIDCRSKYDTHKNDKGAYVETDTDVPTYVKRLQGEGWKHLGACGEVQVLYHKEKNLWRIVRKTRKRKLPK